MQIDLFKDPAAWQDYIYASLVLVFIVFSGWAVLRSRRRVARSFRSFTFRFLTKIQTRIQLRFQRRLVRPHKGDDSNDGEQDLERQKLPSTGQDLVVLKWAASSGRTDIVRSILQTSNKKRKLAFGASGEALLMAIQNGHTEAAILFIDTGEGLTFTDDNNATVLHWAAKAGLHDVCHKLLERGISQSAKDNEGQTALDWAIRGDDELTINLLLKVGSVNRQDTANIQSLHFSARTGDLAMLKEFHKQGSSLEVRDAKGQTVLFHAVKGKQYAIIDWLTDKDRANVQAVDSQGFTALHVAAQECDAKSAEILIDRSANVNALSNTKMTPLLCIPNSEGSRVLILLHEKGAYVNASDKAKNRITHRAASKGDTASLLLKVASDLGADLQAPGAQGNTPAHLAAESGSQIILGLLYQKDIDLGKPRNKAGYTPLMMASRAGRVETMRYLLAKGASHDVVDGDGRSLVELTIDWGNPEVMTVLQQHGADYGNVTAAGANVHPIWKAVHDGQDSFVTQILDAGLSIEYEYRGVRLLQVAIESNNVQVTRLLLDRGAAVDVPDMRGWTALHSAAYAGNTESMLLVLQRIGDDKSPVDQQGWTPLDLAAFYKYDELVKLLDPEEEITEYAWMKSTKARISAMSYYRPPTVDSVIAGVAEVLGHGKNS